MVKVFLEVGQLKRLCSKDLIYELPNTDDKSCPIRCLKRTTESFDFRRSGNMRRNQSLRFLECGILTMAMVLSFTQQSAAPAGSLPEPRVQNRTFVF